MYLGIDLGDKNCGLSIYLNKIVLPKGIVSRTKLVNEIKKIILKYNIKIIVVGLPYDLYNKKIKQLEKTKVFIEKLKKIFPNILVDTVDERFSSFEADLVLDKMGIKNKYGKKDDISAVLILESYLKYNSH